MVFAGISCGDDDRKDPADAQEEVSPEITSACEPACDDGEFCNGVEACVDSECRAGDPPCTGNETCDEDEDRCEAGGPPEGDPYLDALDKHFGHDLHMQEVDGCGECHHDTPSTAERSCIECHNRVEGAFSAEHGAFVPKLKDAMHAPETDSGKKGCRYCHDPATDDGLWLCSHCHLDF